MPLKFLFVDMNAFFASVEQQLRPELRGRPIVVAAVDVDHTSCIAVSHEAKALGIRRGMPIWQVRQFRSVRVVEARPPLYVRAHHDIVAAVDTCLPVHSVDSIDELSCRLTCRQTELSAAIELAVLSTNCKSGSRESDRGVGTQIKSASASDRRDMSVVGSNWRSRIHRATTAESMCPM